MMPSPTHTSRRNEPRRGSLLVAFGAVLLCLCLPILQAKLPPLADFSNHLARAHIAQHIATDPSLQQAYIFEWRPLTNTLFDLLMAVLIPLFGDIYTAARVSLLIYMATLLGGAMALHRVLWQRWSYGPLVAAIFAYNGAFAAGFFSFCLGSALGLWAAAGWFALQQQQTIIRGLYAMGAALMLYLAHLFAFGFFGLIAAGAEAQKIWRAHRAGDGGEAGVASGVLSLSLLALGAIPCLALHLATPHVPSTGADVPVPLLGPLDNLVWPIHVPWINPPLPFSIIGCLLLAYMVAKHPKGLHPNATLAVGVLALMGLLCPEVIWDTSFVSPRFLILCCVLISACWSGNIPRTSAALRHPIVWATVGIFSVSIVTNTLHWRRYEPIANEAIEMARMLPSEARVEHLWNDRSRFGSWVWMHSRDPEPALRVDPTQQILPPNIHIGSLATIEANAFVPLLFTHPSKQLLRASSAFQSLDRTQGLPVYFVTIENDLQPNGSVFDHPSLAPYTHVLVSFATRLSDEQKRRLEADALAKGRWFWLLENPNP